MLCIKLNPWVKPNNPCIGGTFDNKPPPRLLKNPPPPDIAVNAGLKLPIAANGADTAAALNNAGAAIVLAAIVPPKAEVNAGTATVAPIPYVP